MRVLFLQPPSPPGLDVMRDYGGGFGTAEKSERRRFGHDGSPMPYMPFLAAMARVESDLHEVGFVDAQALDLDFEPTLERVGAFAPEVLIIVLSLPSLSEDLAFAVAARRRWPGVSVVVGGTVVKGLTEEVCACAAVDYAITGWGEDSVPDLVNELSTIGRIEEAPGVAWVEDGEIRVTPADDAPARREPDMPPFHLLPMDHYRSWEFPREKSFLTKQYGRNRRYFPIFLSRGCSFGCDYCPYPLGLGARPQVQDPEKVVDQMELLFQTYKVDAFIFQDQNFTLPRSRVAALCSEIISRRLPVMWSCETRVDLVDGPLLKLMKRAGCQRIFFGIETGDRELFESQGKPGVTLAAAGRAFSRCRRAGIIPSAHVVVGLPGETPESVHATERLLGEIGARQGNCGIVTPYPGTTFFERMAETGAFSPGDWRGFTGNDPVMSVPGFTPAQVRQAQERLRHYFRSQAERHWRRRVRRIVVAPVTLMTELRARMNTRTLGGGMKKYGRLLRLRYLRRFFADLGFDCSISRRARVQFARQISIGDDCSIADGVVLSGSSEKPIGLKLGASVTIREYSWLSAHGGMIEIGDRTVVGQSVLIHGAFPCKIGADVLIGGHTAIMPGNHVFSDVTVPIARQGTTSKGINIEDDVWIGANSVILDGVTIARGAVVGAGSVVTKDIPAFAVVCGNPARVIRSRGARELSVG